MTIEALLRRRRAQLAGEGGEDERLTEGFELEKRARLLSQTLRDAVPEATALSLLADLYRKMGRSAEANESEQCALSIYHSCQILVHGGRSSSRRVGLPSNLSSRRELHSASSGESRSRA